MQQDNTWQDKGPGKETSKPRHKTRKKERQEKKISSPKKYTLKKLWISPKKPQSGLSSDS